ncbi:MAG: gephyrin-like molybdotransferase Glp [Polyangiaceae bacterium]
MLTAPQDAIEQVLEGARRLGTEPVDVAEADGRVLAAAVVAQEALPRFTHSSMDGYAVCADPIAATEEGRAWTLPVLGESRAGEPLGQLKAGTACRIFTGARLPIGADAVIMQEDVAREGDQIRSIDRPRPGQFVRQQGEDLAAGTIALPAGLRLDPAAIGLAASLDHAELTVARAPRVSLLSTGDELRRPGEQDRDGSVVESNGMTLAALARRLGAVPLQPPYVSDTRAATEQALAEAIAQSDVVITIGGASVGDHDHVRPAAEALGVELAFWGVAIKPGKPVGYGRKNDAHILCLPGNPASAILTFLLFGAPLLRALQGETCPLPLRQRMTVRGSHTKRTPRTEMLRARLKRGAEGTLEAHLGSSQSSGAVTSFAAADAIVVLDPEITEIGDGETHEVIRIADMIG